MSEILSSLMAEAGPAPEPGLPMSIPDPEPPAPQEDAEISVLKEMLALASEYKALPTVEETERLEMEKTTTVLQKLLADNQRMTDSLSGADPAVRKALVNG